MKTSLSQTFPWGLFRRCGHRLLCADGIIRAAELASTADTFFSIPASIRIKGRRISGYATSEESEGVCVYTFRSHTCHQKEYPQLAWPASWTEENAAILKKAI